jgi:hypothetical protein
MDDVIFKKNVQVEGNVSIAGDVAFNTDTVGTAVIEKGKKTVTVTFATAYKETPRVGISIDIDQLEKEKGETDTVWNLRQEKLENTILNGELRFIVTRKTNKGFVIKLNKNAPENIQFSWTAFINSRQSSVVSHQSSEKLTTENKKIVVSPAVIANSDQENGKTITIRESELGYLRVREKPTSSSDEIGQVKPGQEFSVLEEDNGWYKIEYAPGETGWVSSLYVKVTY